MNQTGARDEAVADRRPITRDGYRRLQQQLEALRGAERDGLRARIKRARLYGDDGSSDELARVAELDLAAVERQIAELEAQLAAVQVVEAPARPDAAGIGTRVTVRYEDGGTETLTLVGPLEADPSIGRVSSESRAGRALVGARPGATVALGGGPDAATLTVTAVAKAPSMADEAVTPLPMLPSTTTLPMAGEGR